MFHFIYLVNYQKFQQGKFFNEQLLINIITQGTLQQVSDALMMLSILTKSGRSHTNI